MVRRSAKPPTRRVAPRCPEPVSGVVDPPTAVEAAIEPLQWFLTAIGDGVRLTQTDNLARSFVVEAAAERGWGQYLAAPPRSADDVPELVTLHELARGMRAVRRTGRRLRVTAVGRELVQDPRRAWEAVVGTLARLRDVEGTSLEVLALLLLDTHSAVSEDWLYEAIAGTLGDEGYEMLPDRARPSPLDALGVLAPLLPALELFVLIERSGPWDSRQVVLTGCGEATLRAVLRLRATALEMKNRAYLPPSPRAGA